jgi:hypothetical protein
MTPHALRKFSCHLGYEIDMFVAMARTLARTPQGTPAFVRNAFVESFAVHTRNLIDFLYPPASPQPDDVTAEHYVVQVRVWQKARGKMPKKLHRAKVRANKQVSHLTRLRYQGRAPQKQWNLRGLVTMLVPRLKKFARHASPGTLHRDVRTQIEALQEAL